VVPQLLLWPALAARRQKISALAAMGLPAETS
jgi:hypothetical protein